MTTSKHVQVPLPASLRKYIRQQKAQLRRQFGVDSEEYKDFLVWIEKKRQEKVGDSASALGQVKDRKESA